MKKRLLMPIVTATVLGIHLLGQAAADVVTTQKIEDKPQECPPLGKGDRWEIVENYSAPNGMNSRGNFSATVTKREGEMAYMDLIGDKGSHIKWELKTVNGAIYPLNEIMGQMVAETVTDIPMCPHPGVGEKTVAVSNLGTKKTVTAVAVEPFFVEVTVPAGTFLTRKVDYHIVHADKEYTFTHYYADGISAVKEVHNFPGGIVLTRELARYEF